MRRSALIFQGIEALIFHLPAGAAGFDQINHIVFGNFDVGNPAVMIGALGAGKEAGVDFINIAEIKL